MTGPAIAYVCTDPGIPVFGTKGASIHVQEMLRAFLARGARVTLFSPRIGTPLTDLTGVKLVPLPPAPSGDAALRARHQLTLNERLTAALRAEGPFDMIYERHALYAHAAMEAAAAMGVAGTLEINAPLIEESRQHRGLALSGEATDSARRCLSAAAVVSAVSALVAAHARTLGAAEARVHVIPNAVNPVRFPAVDRPAGRFTVGFLGTLKPWHDVDTLLGAMEILRRDHPAVGLLIVGDGPERARMQARLDALGAELAGAVSPKEVPGWLARMDVAVAPYRGDQPFYFSPLKIYEYMAAGLPVVASRVGDLDALVQEGRTGLLCPPDDPAALAAALARLARDAAAAHEMGAAGRAQVLRDHTWNGVAGRIFALSGLTRRAA